AMLLLLQCVESDGFSWVVMRTTFWTVCLGILGLRPGRGASFSIPATPSKTNRPRQRAIVCRVTPSSFAIGWSVKPSAAIRIIFARAANLTDEVRARATPSSNSRCVSDNLTPRATRIVFPSRIHYDATTSLFHYL